MKSQTYETRHASKNSDLLPETSTTYPVTIPGYALELGLLATDLRNHSIDLRRQGNDNELTSLANRHAKRAVLELLEELATDGFSWRDIARMAHVSVPAVRKWRQGGAAAPASRLRLARLVALVEMLETQMVSEPSSWLELPVTSGLLLNKIDMIEAGREDLVLEMVSVSAENDLNELLDQFDSQWRTKFRDEEFETFIDLEGMRAIRPRI